VWKYKKMGVKEVVRAKALIWTSVVKGGIRTRTLMCLNMEMVEGEIWVLEMGVDTICLSTVEVEAVDKISILKPI
jgi:hypothetical protein